MPVLIVMSCTLAAVGVYFLPLFVAVKHKQRNLLTLALFNVLVGWTAIGWIVAMLWARHPEIVGHVARTLRRYHRRQAQATVASIVASSQARADESAKSRRAASYSNF
jgi:uncharacterized membrane protein